MRRRSDAADPDVRQLVGDPRQLYEFRVREGRIQELLLMQLELRAPFGEAVKRAGRAPGGLLQGGQPAKVRPVLGSSAGTTRSR